MIDISPFCAKLERPAPDKLRLALYCAPGFAADLARALSRFGVRRKNNEAVICRVATQIPRLARELGLEAALCDLLDAYGKAWEGGRRKKWVPSSVRLERIRATDAVREYGGGSYCTGPRSVVHDMDTSSSCPPPPGLRPPPAPTPHTSPAQSDPT